MGFWDDITGKSGSEAANAAAADQYAKQQAAVGETRASGKQYMNQLLGASRAYDPYVQGGNSALQQLLAGLGLGGQGSSEQFAQGYQNLPGYREGLNTGTQAVTSRLNAGPGIQSGAAMKALQRYGSDYENQRSGDYLQRLMALSGQGLSATGSQVGTQAQGYGGNLQAGLQASNQLYGAAPTIGQGMVAGANAEAAGSQNLLNAGLKLGGMALGAFGGGMGGFGSSFGGSTGGNAIGSLLSPSGSNPFNSDGTRNTWAYGNG